MCSHVHTQKLQCTVAPLKLNFLLWMRVFENNTQKNYFNDLSTDVTINGAVDRAAMSMCVHRRKANHYALTAGILICRILGGGHSLIQVSL